MGSAKKKVLVVAGVIAFLSMIAVPMMGWRFFSYVRAHGGGMPAKTEQDEYVLNDHGEYTPVPKKVYDEARKRWWLFLGSVGVVISAFGMFFFIFLVNTGKLWLF